MGEYGVLVALVVIIVAPVVIVFWAAQFLDLMNRDDGKFPGRYDKPTWAAIMLVYGPVGALLYFIAKPRRSAGKSGLTGEFGTNPARMRKCLQGGQTIAAGQTECAACGWSYSSGPRASDIKLQCVIGWPVCERQHLSFDAGIFPAAIRTGDGRVFSPNTAGRNTCCPRRCILRCRV